MWYLIYTNKLPEVVHAQNYSDQERTDKTSGGGGCTAVQRPETTAQAPRRPLYRTGDSKCGALVCFADNSSESFSDQIIEELKTSMELQYASAASFLTSSMLQVNGDKTHAMLLTSTGG